MQEITQRILSFNKDCKPELASLKYKAMTEDAFRFFRGTCHIFYEDLSKEEPLFPSPLCWVCGDLHLENFGSFKGDNSLVYFDINDFDESVLAPVIMDVVRVITSILLAFDALHLTQQQTTEAVEIFLKYFSKILSVGRGRYIERQTATGEVKKFLKAVARRKQQELLQERTRGKGKNIRLFKGEKQNLKIVDKIKKTTLLETFSQWMKSYHELPHKYEVIDVSYRIAGTGSLGYERFLFLISNIDEPGKYKFMDMKQATPSSLIPYIKNAQPYWETEAERIVSVQKRMQNITPAQLSTHIFNGHSYVIQEMQPSKDRINFKLIDHEFNQICCVMEDMGMITASVYLNSSGRQGSAIADELISFGQNKEWHNSVIDYAKHYIIKVKKDFQDFKSDYKNILLKHPL